MRSATPPHPPKRPYRSQPGPPVTLRSACEWFWFGCYVCNHRVATKSSIFMNLLGPDYPLEDLRRRGWCTVCGSFGAYSHTPSHSDMIVGDEPFMEERSYYYHLRTLEEAGKRSYLVYDAMTREVWRNDLTIGQAVQGALRANGQGVYTVQPPGRLIVSADNGFRVEI